MGLTAVPVVVALIFGTMAVAVAPVGADSTWSVAPSPSPLRPDSADLSAVSCADATTCFAVGNRNKDYLLDASTGIVIEQWNGSTWSTVVGPAGGGNLSAVACPTATRCFAVGGQGTGTLIEQWDGTSWGAVASPNPNGTNAELNGVSCWSVNRCIAVGDWRSRTKANTLVERWDGAGWHIDASPNPAGSGASLSAVSCPNVTSCFAVGTHQESWEYPYKGGALLEHWNGTAWKIQPSPAPNWHTPNQIDGLLIVPLLDGISCPAPRSCTAVGYTPTDALVEHWNGTKWSLVASPHPAPQESNATIAALRAVDCATSNDCMAVGITFVPIDYRDGAPAANSIAEHWNGKAWAIVARPRNVPATVNGLDLGELSALSGVSCPAANQCAAVGNSAMAERWDGATWSLAPLEASTSWSALLSVACPSATACFAVGDAYPLLAVADHPLIERWNGTTWSVMAAPTVPGTNTFAELSSISCVTAADCTAVGGYYPRLSKTSGMELIEHWNGSKWMRVSSPVPSKSETEGFFTGVACASAIDCNAVGSSTNSSGDHLLAEHWNGATWSIVALPGPGSSVVGGISCPSDTSCFAVGETPTFRALIDHWDGARWTAMTSPAPASGGAYALRNVSCPSTTDCTAIGEAGGYARPGTLTLVEHWDGTSWSIAPSPTPTSTHLQMYGVSCTSTTNCTAVGATNEFAYGPPNPPTPATPIIEHWDGNTWSLVAAPTPAPPINASSLFGVTCTDETGCIAVGAGWGSNDLYPSYATTMNTLVERDT